jgi:uncharacterized protein (TIGR02996 family)
MAKKRPLSQDDAFLHDIIENAADNTPRLVYADWLDEHGNAERAEFIRLQIEHARLDADDPRRWDLSKREETLLKAHGTAWMQNLTDWAREGRCWFRRGFVAEVTATVDQFLDGAAALRRATPLEGVALQQAAGRMADVASCPGMTGLSHLDLSGANPPLQAADVRGLVRSRHLAGLRSLDLDFQRIGNEGMQALGQAAGVGPLEALYLEHGFWSIDLKHDLPATLDLRPLADSPHRDHLTTLYLGNNEMIAESFAALGNFPRLTTLTLGRVEPAAAKVLVGAPPLAGLRLLRIGSRSSRVETTRALAGSPHLAGLVALELPHCGLSDASARVLAASPHLTNLRHLDLAANHFSDTAAQEMADSPLLAKLLTLNLRNNRIGDTGAKALAASPHLTDLRQLDLRWNEVGPEGAAALRRRFGTRVRCRHLEEKEHNPHYGTTFIEEYHFRRRRDLRGAPT